MPWTGEDTKDVFKKVLGGLIAAAVITLGYAVIEEMPWYFAALLGVGLIVLILLLVWRLSSQKGTEAGIDEKPVDDGSAHATPVEASSSEAVPAQVPSSEEGTSGKQAEEKALKKIAKAEQKRLKKEAKAKKKSAE